MNEKNFHHHQHNEVLIVWLVSDYNKTIVLTSYSKLFLVKVQTVTAVLFGIYPSPSTLPTYRITTARSWQ